MALNLDFVHFEILRNIGGQFQKRFLGRSGHSTYRHPEIVLAKQPIIEWTSGNILGQMNRHRTDTRKCFTQVNPYSPDTPKQASGWSYKAEWPRLQVSDVRNSRSACRIAIRLMALNAQWSIYLVNRRGLDKRHRLPDLVRMPAQ